MRAGLFEYPNLAGLATPRRYQGSLGRRTEFEDIAATFGLEYSTRLMSRLIALFALVLLPSCDRPPPAQGSTAGAVNSSAPSNSAPSSTLTTGAPSASAGLELASLRRAYGPHEMKTNPCAQVGKDGTIVGHQCPADIIVFGPYVATPDNAEVKVSFDIESEGPLQVTSDVVSQVGRLFHGAIEDDAVDPGKRRHIAYRVRIPQGTAALESRVSVRGEGPTTFRIYNLSVAVQ